MPSGRRLLPSQTESLDGLAVRDVLAAIVFLLRLELVLVRGRGGLRDDGVRRESRVFMAADGGASEATRSVVGLVQERTRQGIGEEDVQEKISRAVVFLKRNGTRKVPRKTEGAFEGDGVAIVHVGADRIIRRPLKKSGRQRVQEEVADKGHIDSSVGLASLRRGN